MAIGDSITEGLSSYGFLSEEQVFSKIGVLPPVGTVHDLSHADGSQIEIGRAHV